ncbi:MAG: T9SS type A sorting domain-containing protein, partial [Melioribacteraceae bacterium]
GLMKPGETGLVARPGYGLYRVQVDLMGHEILGKKNLVYLMDALWGTDHELNPPTKWQTEPFNNDWTSSVFASFDPVAIESVGYDLIRTEFTKERYPTSYEDVVDVIQMEGVCDYLKQAADSSNWPEGIKYDPENDGTILTSLGVHEHWNNPTDKQYSKNLGTGNGIELIKISKVVSILESPSLLSAEIINNSDVNLSWQDNSTEEDGFIIERKENSQTSEYVAIDTVAENITTFTDVSDKLVSSYYYRIKAFNSTSSSDYTEPVIVNDLTIVGIDNEFITSEFKLHQNYPNPFNPNTTITFSIKNNADVKLVVYDAIGRLVKILIDQKLSSGEHKIDWNGKNYLGISSGSGVYFYKFTINLNKTNYSETKKMILEK